MFTSVIFTLMGVCFRKSTINPIKTNIACVPQLVLHPTGVGPPWAAHPAPCQQLCMESSATGTQRLWGCCGVTSGAQGVPGWVFLTALLPCRALPAGSAACVCQGRCPPRCRDAAKAPLMGRALGWLFHQELGGGRVLRRRKREGRRKDNYFFQWL